MVYSPCLGEERIQRLVYLFISVWPQISSARWLVMAQFNRGTLRSKYRDHFLMSFLDVHSSF